MLKSLEELINIIRERKSISSDNSYTNKLLNNREMCIEKVNEEIDELLEAIKKKSNNLCRSHLDRLNYICKKKSRSSYVNHTTSKRLFRRA